MPLPMYHRTRVKYCGITRADDALLAVELGVDALGFVFFDQSPRHITTEAAAHIIARVPPFVCKVGLFVNATVDAVERLLRELPLDLLQFHGDETPAYCASFDRPYIKAVRVSEKGEPEAAARRFATAGALLLDTYVAHAYGGTGAAFDWSLIPSQRSLPVILAGGLDADNVAAAIAAVRPYAVDVSSGIESAKGIKDPAKMTRFMHEVRNIEC